MKLKKCKSCKAYSMEDKCPRCSKPTSDAHYKFVRLKTQESKEIQKNNGKN